MSSIDLYDGHEREKAELIHDVTLVIENYEQQDLVALVKDLMQESLIFSRFVYEKVCED